MMRLDRHARPRVLFFAPILEYPPAGGPQISVINAIKVLHRLSELHIMTTVPRAQVASPEAQQFLRNHCHRLVHTPSSFLASNQRLIQRVLRKARRVGAPLVARLDLPFLEHYATRNDIEVLWIDRVVEHAFSVLHQLRKRMPTALVVGDTEAVHSRFVLREVPLISNPVRRAWITFEGRRKEREERELVAIADVVTAVSEVDADYFRGLASESSRIALFSNVIDVNEYESAIAYEPVRKQPLILLLGSFGHQNSPMDRAAKWLVRDIMPLVWRRVPNARLFIIGRNAQLTQSTLNSENITVVGQVSSVLPYLKQASVTVVPLRFESGTRFKIIESGAAGVPCVSTSLGAEGLDVTDEKDILIADTAEAFANAIARILLSPELAESLGRALRALIVARYSLDVQTEEGRAILARLGLTAGGGAI